MSFDKIVKKTLIAWLISPFLYLLISLCFFSSDELSFAHQVVSSFFFSFYILLTIYFVFNFIKDESVYKSKFKLTLYLAPIAVLIIYFIKLNSFKKRISLSTGGDSPFDQGWYSWPQTSYGYPSPFIRFFDKPYLDFGSTIIDYSSFFGNIAMLFFIVYIWSMAALVAIRINRKSIATE